MKQPQTRFDELVISAKSFEDAAEFLQKTVISKFVKYYQRVHPCSWKNYFTLPVKPIVQQINQGHPVNGSELSQPKL